MYHSAFISFDHFLDSGAKIGQIFCWFRKILKNQKEILKVTDLYTLWYRFDQA